MNRLVKISSFVAAGLVVGTIVSKYAHLSPKKIGEYFWKPKSQPQEPSNTIEDEKLDKENIFV